MLRHLQRISSCPETRAKRIRTSLRNNRAKRQQYVDSLPWQAIKLLYKKGLGAKLIARRLQLSHKTVIVVLKHLKLYKPGRLKPLPGKGHYSGYKSEHDKWLWSQTRGVVRQMKSRARKCLHKKAPRQKWDSFKHRYQNDLEFRIKNCLRRRIRKLIESGKRLTNATRILLGCSIREFTQHIEKQFQPGMSWDNYGEWELDHIKPCCQFDLTQIEQQRLCFHFSNYRPLWAIDNRSRTKQRAIRQAAS